MAAKRGKTQARRAGGNGGGLPGWAWLVIGIALTLLVVLAAPRLFKDGDGGFFRPKPNPDAQPQPVDEEAVVDPEASAPPVEAEPERPAKATEYDFYRLLPGQEVPMSDAELAASERAERERTDREAAAQEAADAAASASAPAVPLPAPVQDPEPPTAPAPPASPVAPGAPVASSPPVAPGNERPATPTADSTRYVLQAGAFEASGQAEELKAKIAMLGLGARVESAQIDGRTVYRVRMGPYGSATELAEAKRKLASGGLPAIAVKTQ